MNIVEINGSLGNGLKRYNVFEQVSISNQPFTQRASVLYGITKPTDVVQTYQPTNILVDVNGSPIGNSKPVYFGIRVYPFISARQQVSCGNNNITYGRYYGLSNEYYFTNQKDFSGLTLIPTSYTGQLYPEPIFEDFSSASQQSRINYKQAMQQFINDCVFPTKPNLDIPGQSISAGYGEDFTSEKIPYFNYEVVVLDKLNQRDARGILSQFEDKDTSGSNGFEKYMVQFDGQNLNFKFGMAVNSDFEAGFAEIPDIYLPYLYRTYGALLDSRNICLGLIMQCLLYDSNGNVITG